MSVSAIQEDASKIGLPQLEIELAETMNKHLEEIIYCQKDAVDLMETGTKFYSQIGEIDFEKIIAELLRRPQTSEVQESLAKVFNLANVVWTEHVTNSEFKKKYQII